MLSLQVVVGLLSLVGTAFGLLSDEEVQRITKIIKSENQCFMHRQDKFDYKVCPGGLIPSVVEIEHAKIRNLGKWDKEELDASFGYSDYYQAPELTVWLKGGDSCRRGSVKSRVRYVCGVKSKVVRFEEISACEYHMSVASPLLCVPIETFDIWLTLDTLATQATCTDFFDGESTLEICNGSHVRMWPSSSLGFAMPNTTVDYENGSPILKYDLLEGSQGDCWKAREGSLIYQCEPALAKDLDLIQVLSVKEVSPCSYDVRVHVSALCVDH